MSTFDGIVEEFPDIRIDYFRQHSGRTSPAACFLSHVHSDHLLGLETLRMPFVYCSAATRRLLLQMEKYPHRVNFSKGILESRKQTYKHLKFILRALPLQTPIELELTPKVHIKVTLFDANHCPGAVMFLIEDTSHAILYTGDIRAESWWVNSIVRNPILVPFATGQKRLDCLYLDTTFASHQDIYRDFPSKAEGLAELTRKIKQSPNNSIFYFRAWTLGYEDVWITLRNILGSQIHVDRYQVQLFRSIAQDGINAGCGSALVGFTVGNEHQQGCLTQDEDVRIHSCEPGMICHRSLSKRGDIVWITPIISRSKDGKELAEVGAGGGGGDLYQKMEVDFGNQSILEGLRLLCSSIANDPEASKQAEAALEKARKQHPCQLVLDGLGLDPDEEISIKDFVKLLSGAHTLSSPKVPTAAEPEANTTRVIHFPFSRHSSYSELRELIGAFRPRDICPCTVSLENWSEELSMRSLFGDLCSSNKFRYDDIVRQEVYRRGESATTATEERISQQQMSSQLEMDERSQVRVSSQETDVFEEATTTMAAIPDNEAVPTELIESSDPEQPAIIDQAVDIKPVWDRWQVTNDGSNTYELSVIKNAENQLETSSVGSPETQTRMQVSSSSQLQKRQALTADVNDLVTQNQVDDSRKDCSADIDGNPRSSFKKRKKAFEAAKACLNGDPEQWTNLRLRSMGWKGHTEEEQEL